jgi:hypothetical protein
LKLRVGFGTIDWYDDETDMYETPVVYIERGLKRARYNYRNHGSIPKDWSIDLTAIFSDTTTNTAILEVVKKALYSKFSKDVEKKFIKELRPVLQKKKLSAQYYSESDDND